MASLIVSSALTFIVVTLLGANNASPFTIQISHHHTRQTAVRRTTTATTQPPRHKATIIGWDDESNSYKSTFDDMNMGSILNTDIDTTPQHEFTSIADHLSHNQEKTSSLARLAVAFSPPEQALNLDDINHIQIIEVANNRIELSAVVCDESECVTLFVPVTFPHECSCGGGLDDTKQCVLDNIFALDLEAQEVLKQRHELKNREEPSNDQQKELMAALYDNYNIEFPSWWIAPKTRDMSDECQQVKSIMNQDEFQHQVKALASKGLAFCEDGDLFEIQRAVVCSIGPAGFYFRAIATKKKDEMTMTGASSRGFCEDTSCTILDIPLQVFDETTTISEPAAFRAALIGAMASISET